MDRKSLKVFITAAIVLGSLYLNYRQYHEIKYCRDEIVSQQHYVLMDAYWEINDIVGDGCRALATGQQDKAREYLAEFDDGQRILNRYVLRRFPSGNLREFHEVSDIFDRVYIFSKNTVQKILDDGWTDENRAAFEDLLREYTRMGVLVKEIAENTDEKEFSLKLKPALQEFAAEFDRYRSGGQPLFSELSEEEQEARREASRRYKEERDAVIKAFEPEALKIARDFLGSEIEGYEELGVNGYGYGAEGVTTIALEFRKGNKVKNVEVTTDGYISGYNTDYIIPGKGSGDLPGQKENLTEAEAVQRAREFLADRLGIKDVYLESSGRTPDGLFEASFKERMEGIIIGKYWIDVEISPYDGTVINFFRPIITPEERERIRQAAAAPPSITREQAKRLIGKRNSDISEGELYCRYDDVLAWRFEVLTSGVRQFIYIDAHTGEEVEIMRAERI